MSVGRRFLTSPVELSATLDPMLAVVSRRNGHKRDDTDATRIQGRVGVSLRAAKAILRPLRLLVAIDGDLAPGDAFDHDSSFTPMTPGERAPAPFPTYTLGLSIGAELVLR